MNEDAEVTVEIQLPKAVERSLSSSILQNFNFTFNIPALIYKPNEDSLLVQSDNKLNQKGEAAKQAFIDIAYNFVKEINRIREANPIVSLLEMFKNSAPDLMDSAKLFFEWRKSRNFHLNNCKKGEFERAADCYGAIPNVLEHSLAYIKSGHFFNDNDQFIVDMRK